MKRIKVMQNERNLPDHDAAISRVETWRERLQESFCGLIKRVGKIPIGTPRQFPFGWRKAGKGRTVWRIIEEILAQNLEHQSRRWGLVVEASPLETSVWDVRIKFQGERDFLYVNFKSAVAGNRISKDDISKADGLLAFFNEDPQRQLFLATVLIEFEEDMSLNLQDCVVMPIAWLPDVYVNPSRNGNLQSAQYRDLSSAIRRTNREFLGELSRAQRVAINKQAASAGQTRTTAKKTSTGRAKPR